MVEDLKRALPSPPFPPFAITISTDSGLISPISSPVSSACIIVPFGTGIERFSPDSPFLFFPAPDFPAFAAKTFLPFK